MENLKTLGVITVGAIVLSASYAVAVKDRGAGHSIEFGDERSTRHSVSGDRGEFILKDDGVVIEANWRGAFDLNPLGTDIDRLERRFEITREKDGNDERVVFERKHGDIIRAYYLDGEAQPDGPDADAAITELLIAFLRASGVKAEERVAALLKQGGPEEVLDDMLLLDGDESLRRYAAALAEQAELSSDEVAALIDLLNNLESDHDLRLALSAIMEHETISPELTPALIKVASNIESDHDLRKLVEDFAARPLDDAAMELIFGLYEGIESDHDLRIAAEALLENDAVNDAAAARLLSAAADQIDSDHDLRLILAESAAMFSNDPAVTDAWLKGYFKIDSSDNQRRAITEVAEIGEHTADAWRRLIEATTAIDSSHDQRLALVAIADRIEADASLLAAYRAAAAKIESDHDRRRALEAIGERDQE